MRTTTLGSHTGYHGNTTSLLVFNYGRLERLLRHYYFDPHGRLFKIHKAVVVARSNGMH